jgi:hypothetical protein
MNSKRHKNKLKRIKARGERYKREKEVRDAYAEYWPERKKRKVSNIMLVVIVAAILGYTIASFWLQYTTGVPIDSTLTTLYYGFWSVELISLTSIRNNKTKYGDDNSCD